MKILIYNSNYPSEDNLLGDVFVHVRAKKYMQEHDVVIVSFSEKVQKEYEYQGVSVITFNSTAQMKDFILSWKPDVLCIHFYEDWMYDSLISYCQVPVLVWIHGYGAMKWQRRLFEIEFGKSMLGYIRSNSKQLSAMKKLVGYSNSTGRVHFVFVSKWIHDVMSNDIGMSIKKSSIIPNPIDESLFKYETPQIERRLRVLSIRPFHTRKYATDLICGSIKALSKTKYFSKLEFSIYGQGRFFETDTRQINRFSNVHLMNYFIPNNELPKIHDMFGLFLCPSRLDTHGVSMCEAMSSGLVCITSNNSAIPEYLTNMKSGILTLNKIEELTNAIIYLADNPNEYLSMSENAAKESREKCSIKKIIPLEINLILDLISNKNSLFHIDK